ncbi:MAG: AAA family ATPase [Clostridia bacterium]|nr:AAA family ATPase [Clostridia bacterium]
MDNKEWQLEQDYLDKTVKVIDQQIETLSSSIAETKQFVSELRDYYVRGTQIFGDIDPYERVGINERIDNLIEIGNQNIDKTEKLKRNRGRPYFGRVRFESKKADDDFYVGLMGIEQDNKYYVYDWRAPICELFYDYGLGEASFRSPVGKIDGKITLKRQYDIQNGKLIDMYDKDINIFDDYLQKVLSKISTDKLHNIASTIQAEQNAIIRDLKNDLVVVQGYAGSGKTTVALHRIAYALYRLKDLNSANILIFTLNEAFMSHIEGVLPELGEQNTRSATMAKFIGRLLKTPRHFEESDMFLSRYLGLSDDARAIVKAKLDLKMKEKIGEWVENLINNTTAIKGFKLRDIPFSPKLLNRLFLNDYGDLPYFNRFNAITDFVVRKTKVEDKAPIRAQIKQHILECFNANTHLESLYKSMCLDCGFGEPDLSVIKTEDAILMCVLKSKLSDVIVKMNIRHIIIDEAQEYPALFLDFLFGLFPRAQFSIFGDKYQQTHPLGTGDLKSVLQLKHYGEGVYYELDNTYRSSEEIVEYCSKIIGNPRHNAFRLLNNEPVIEKDFSDKTKLFNEISAILNKEIVNNGTIGVITGDVQTAKEIVEKLSKKFVDKVGLVDTAKSDAYTQVQVIPVSLSKGLEFNTAIVVKSGGLFDGEMGTNLKYIACTRAINKLYVLNKN